VNEFSCKLLAAVERLQPIGIAALTNHMAARMELVTGTLSYLKRSGEVVHDADMRWSRRKAGNRSDSDKGGHVLPSDKAGPHIVGLNEHKTCCECHQTLHIEAFRKVRGGGRTKICNNCHNSKIKAGISAAQARGSITVGPPRRTAQLEHSEPNAMDTESAPISRAEYPVHVLAVLNDLLERQEKLEDAVCALQIIYGDYPEGD